MNPTLSNIYSSPGMKNIKFMVISVFDGNGIDEDSPFLSWYFDETLYKR